MKGKTMDPDATLREIREIIKASHKEVCDDEDKEFEYLENMGRLTELVEALDNWITGGGFLPNDWKEDIRPKHVKDLK